MFVQKAKELAIKLHSNQKYGDYDYIYHLEHTFRIANGFRCDLISDSFDIISASCYLHDILEDTPVSYNDIKTIFGVEVADIVYALTEEKGKNRAERHNQKYWDGIKANRLAIFVKICDRIANIESSISENNEKMLQLHRKESNEFKYNLFNGIDFIHMWNYIEKILMDGFK